MPAIWTRRVWMSMTKRTKYRARPASVSTSTVKKSVAAIESKWAFKKVAQGIRRRREGAGSTVLEEDALDGVAGEDVSKVAQGVTNPRVAPARILRGEPDDEVPKCCGRPRTTGSAPSSTVVLGGDELTVPAKNRVGRHKSGELVQRASAQHSALRREAPALVVGEPQLTATQLLAEHAVLFLQVVDHRDLAPVYPTGERHQQELQRRGAHAEPPYRAESRGQTGPRPAASHDARSEDARVFSPIVFWHLTNSGRTRERNQASPVMCFSMSRSLRDDDGRPYFSGTLTSRARAGEGPNQQARPPKVLIDASRE